MKYRSNIPLVTTIEERCRVCYTCVRECPAKAIQIVTGQAKVIPERCIGCGNCVRVCSQHAKQVLNSRQQVAELLAGGQKVAACLAPSFAAEFVDCPPASLVGMLRAMGFSHVCEVSFGADLVADRYRKLLAAEPIGPTRYIATTCPAIVAYVERYHPDMAVCLAPIVSPMIALSRALKRKHGSDLRIVFIGPCIAKKGEAASENVGGEIDAALTFVELREMLQEQGFLPSPPAGDAPAGDAPALAEIAAGPKAAVAAVRAVQPSQFDPPRGGAGALFSVSRGLLQAANIKEDLLDGDVVATDGRRNFVEALKEFSDGDLSARLLEVLCCEGCIMGAGMSCDLPLFTRRRHVSRYAQQRLAELDMDAWRKELASYDDLDLSRCFQVDDQRIVAPFAAEIATIMARMGKFASKDELNCGACGYDSCREHAMAIFKGLAESEMCLPYTIEQLRKTVKDLAASNEQLASAQEALMQSEKLASMGQLAAGIAHEVNNPLGVVLMYAHLLLEQTGSDAGLRDDLGVIAREADRCKKIVAGLLDFARQNKLSLQPTDVVELAAHALKAVGAANVTVQLDRQLTDPIAELDRDQIAQVLTNLITNACAAMPHGGTLTLRVGGDDQTVAFDVIDTGVGIPAQNLKKIFDPFFTTKPIGKGTGLGLAVTYGIVKMHRGDITVVSNARKDDPPTGTTFTVKLPRRTRQD